jgi:hypothetical protein
MSMSNDDLDWLAAQQPKRIGIDGGARERALLALVQRTSARPGERGFGLPSLVRTRLFSFAAATGAAAIAAALIAAVLVLPSAEDGGGGAAATARLGQNARGPQAAVHHHSTARSPLVRLADYVSASPAPVGDATLVTRTTTLSSGKTVTVYDLYADDGRYFFSPTESGLPGQVSADNNQADGLFAREIAAAKLAANGDVQTAAQDMADAPDPSHVISPTHTASPGDIGAKRAAQGIPPDGSYYNDYVWENSQDALIAGSGDPQVRAGVLEILATLPGVTVTNGTSDGQPTLVLRSGSPELGLGYTEQLTINADTGVPIQFIGGQTGGPPATIVDYQVSRVTLANLPSGTASSESGTTSIESDNTSGA